MGEFTAIAEVGQTLIGLLRDEFAARPDAPEVDSTEVALVSPSAVEMGGATANDFRLTLYLYRVVENEHLKNAERREVDATTFREAPLALDLYYLLTAHPTGDEEADTVEQHQILGLAVQVLRDNPIIGGSTLQGSLDDADEDIHVSIVRQPMDEVVNVWSTFQETPFRPSVSYLVTPVRIEPERTETVPRVVQREAGYFAEPPGSGADSDPEGG